MKIAQIAPIIESIPPKKYGGTERMIYALTQELIRRGHKVTLFASGNSKTSDKLVSVVPQGLKEMRARDIYGPNISTMINIGKAYGMQEEFDIIHDHNPHYSLPTANMAKVPVVVTWHGAYNQEIIKYFSLLHRPYRVAISKTQAELARPLPFTGIVYNGLYLDHYPFAEKPSKSYLLFIGRLDAEKAPHVAIDVAVRLNKKLIIAAKLDDMVPPIKNYFETFVRPRLKKHRNLIKWIGEVGEEEKTRLMTNAEALLHTQSWPEPFGLAIVEAMACGCPVIAFDKGAIPELIINGKTGYVVKTFSEMVEAVKKVNLIDRRAAMRHARMNFNAQRMADGYEKVYEKVLKLEAAKKMTEPVMEKGKMLLNLLGRQTQS